MVSVNAYVWVPDKHERLLAPGRNITTLKKKDCKRTCKMGFNETNVPYLLC